ncbi:MAG: ComEC/Rec2 family competence protein [Acetobacteraceae bacterium]
MQQAVSLAPRRNRPAIAATCAAASGLAARLLTAEQRRFVLWLPVVLLSGALAYFQLDYEPPVWAGPAIAALGLVFITITRQRPLVAALGLLPLAFGLGFAAAQLATLRAPPIAHLPRHAVTLAGRVAALEPLPNGARITIAHPSIDGARPIARSVRIRLRRGDPIVLGAGDEVRVRSMVEPPAAPSYPGAWDVQRKAFFAGLAGYGFALGHAQRLAPARHGGFGNVVEPLREAVAARVLKTLPGAVGAISATLLTGISTAIPESDRAAFRDAGLSHLLSVAGLHIGIVMGLVFMLARALLALSERASLFWPTKAIAAVAALLAGGFYMLLTGMHVPFMRSFVMAVLGVLGLAAGRRVISLRGLGLAATVLLLAEPSEATGVSFQMSFAAVMVLIAGYEVLRPWLSRLHGGGRARRLGMHVLALALTSLLAGTAALPFGAYHFGHIQIYYVLANIIAVPVTAFWVLPAGLAALVLMPFSLQNLALVPMGLGVRLLLAIARAVSSLPAARLAVPHIPALGLAVIALGLAWLCLWRSRLRLAGIPLMLCGLIVPLISPPPDIVVSRTAGLIGFATPAGVFVEKTGRGVSRFTRQAWQQLWFTDDLIRLPKSGSFASGRLRCAPTDCLFRPRRGGPSALLLRGPADPRPCPKAAVVVAPEPDRGRCVGGGIPFVDRFSVWRNGATSVWLTRGGVRIVSDRSLRGRRPWVPKPPTPWKTANAAVARLPLAKTVPLPPPSSAAWQVGPALLTRGK